MRQTRPYEDAFGGEAEAWRGTVIGPNRDRRIYVPWSLGKEVTLHFVMNHWGETRAGAPLILLTTGPFGSGKTVIVDECLYRLGVKVTAIQGSELESPMAGVPAERIEKLYMQAGMEQEETKRPHAILLSDLDTGIGVHDSFKSGTTNLMHVTNALMTFADDPTTVRGQSCGRVCLFVTANAAGRIYGAVTRPGRARVIPWCPEGREREDIARHILSPVLSPEMIDLVLARTPHWTMAHYGALKNGVLEDTAVSRFGDVEPKQLLRALLADPAPASDEPNRDQAISWEALAHLIGRINKHIEAVQTDHTQPTGVTTGELP